MRKYTFFVLLVIGWTIVFTGSLALGMDGEHFKTKEQCLNCHGKKELNVIKEGKNLSLYVDSSVLKNSVHGDYECNVCHSFDDKHVYGRELTDKVSEKCAYCHTGAAFELKRGVHMANGNEEKPNCVSCHGGHAITKTGNPQSLVSGKNIAATCGEQCHQVEYAQFVESFHGKATTLGAKEAPSCTTCHGSHKILSKTNPADKTHPDKKPLLCVKCHEGEVLGAGSIEHYEVKAEGYGKPMYYVKTKMPWLIIVVMGVFLTHTILDLIYRIRTRNSLS